MHYWFNVRVMHNWSVNSRKLLITITTCPFKTTGAYPTFILLLRGNLEVLFQLVYLLLQLFLLLFSRHDLHIHLTQLSSLCVTEIACYLLPKWRLFLRWEQKTSLCLHRPTGYNYNVPFPPWIMYTNESCTLNQVMHVCLHTPPPHNVPKY